MFKPTLVTLVATFTLFCFTADTNAQIGKFFKNLDPTNKNSALRKGVKQLDPTNKNSAVRKGAKNLDITNKNSAIRKGAKNLDVTNKNSAIRDLGRNVDPTNRDGALRENLRKIDPIEALKKEAYFAYRSKYMKFTTGKPQLTLQPTDVHYKRLKLAQDRGIFPKMDLTKTKWIYRTPVPPDMAAITFGNKVLVQQFYNSSDPNLTILMAHELIHVLQNQRLGGEAKFAQRYINSSLRDWKKNFSMSAAYKNNGLELEAQRYEKAFYDWLVIELAKEQKQAQQIANNQTRPQPQQGKLPDYASKTNQQPEFQLPKLGTQTRPKTRPYPRPQTQPPHTRPKNIPKLPVIKKNYFGMQVAMVSRPNLGLTMQVQSVTAGSPAANAGLEYGDEIVTVNGRAFTTGDSNAAIQQLQQFTRSAHSTTHTLVVRNVQNGQLVQVPITPSKQ